MVQHKDKTGKKGYGKVHDQDTGDVGANSANRATHTLPVTVSSVSCTSRLKSNGRFWIVLVLFIEFIIVAGVGSKVLMVSYSDTQDEYHLTVASGLNYTYQQCQLDTVNDEISNMIDTYTILYSLFCVFRFGFLLHAAYLAIKYDDDASHCVKFYCVGCVINIIIGMACFIYYIVGNVIEVKDVTHGSDQVDIGFYQNIRIHVTWSVDMMIFGALVMIFRHYKTVKAVVNLNADTYTNNMTRFTVIMGFGVFFLFYCVFVPLWLYFHYIYNLALHKDPFLSVNVIASKTIGGRLWNSTAVNSTTDFMYTLHTECRLFDLKEKNDIGINYHALRIDDLINDQDIKFYLDGDSMDSNDNDDYGHFELYMYCEYTEKTSFLTECSLYKAENRMEETVIVIIPIEFKTCETSDIDLVKGNKTKNLYPIMLRMTICYDQFVSPHNMPYQW